jgi:hypothetical protein
MLQVGAIFLLKFLQIYFIAHLFTIFYSQLTMDLLLSAGVGNYSYDFDDLLLDGMDFGLVQAVLSGDIDVPSGDVGVNGSNVQNPSPSGPLFKSKIIYNSFKWTKKDGYKKTDYYQCPSFRSPMLCNATLKLTADGQILVKGSHICGQDGTLENVVVGEIYDAEYEMKTMIENNCLLDQNKTASEVAKSVFNDIVLKYRGNSISYLFVIAFIK